MIAVITTTNTSLLALTAASRLLYGMAGSGALPAALTRAHPRTGAPVRAIWVAAIGAIAFALVGDLRLIASVTDFAVYVVFLAVNATVIVLRRREPDRPRPFRSPVSLRGVPLLPVRRSDALVTLDVVNRLRDELP